MKKFVALLLAIVSAAVLFAACSKYPEVYDGKPIEKVTVVKVDYFGGATDMREYDFVKNVLTEVENVPYDEALSSTRTFKLDPEKYESFFNDLSSCGFFSLKELYAEQADDGGEVSITVTFTDKTTFKTRTVNSSNGIEDEIESAFKNLKGE